MLSAKVGAGLLSSKSGPTIRGPTEKGLGSSIRSSIRSVSKDDSSKDTGETANYGNQNLGEKLFEESISARDARVNTAISGYSQSTAAQTGGTSSDSSVAWEGLGASSAEGPNASYGGGSGGSEGGGGGGGGGGVESNNGGNLAAGNHSFNGTDVNFMKDKNGAEYGSDAISRILGVNFTGHVGTDGFSGSMRSASTGESDILSLVVCP